MNAMSLIFNLNLIHLFLEYISLHSYTTYHIQNSFYFQQKVETENKPLFIAPQM